jgi:hypothetical protein
VWPGGYTAAAKRKCRKGAAAEADEDERRINERRGAQQDEIEAGGRGLKREG